MRINLTRVGPYASAAYVHTLMQEDRHRAKVATNGHNRADRSSSASLQGTSATVPIAGATEAARHAKELAALLELARGQRHLAPRP